MPITGLYLIPDPSAPIREHLTDRLQKRHQPTTTLPFRLEHRLLRSTSAPNTYIQILDTPHLSPLPFALCGTAIITIERDFAGLLATKMAALWQHRQTIRCEGVAYEVHDFRVRVGRILVGDQPRGVVVEVEYLPVDSMRGGGAEGVLRAFVEGLELACVGKWVLGEEEGEEWGVLDTGRLYCELLRKELGNR